MKDSPPFGSQHGRELSAEKVEQWKDQFTEGVKLERMRRYSEAAAHFRAAVEIDEGYAELQFRLGRCLWSLDQFEEAKSAFVRAHAMDTLLYRADDGINAVIREAAAAYRSEGAVLVDAQSIFASHGDTSHGVPGKELFYDHVAVHLQ